MVTREEIQRKVKNALDELYRTDQFLFEKKLCERCINHKFAVYLEKQSFGEGYFVDCEYNKSHLNSETSPKYVSNPNGNYIDIIITKRNGVGQDDLVCFETKRWDKYKGRKKDRKNLKILTAGQKFAYKLGLYVIFGQSRDKVKIEVYEKGILAV